MRVLVILLALQGAVFMAKAQDLTGQWTGVSTDNISEIKHKIVLNIASGDSLFGGVLHWYYPATQFFRNFIVRGQFHSKDSTLSIREDSLDNSNPASNANDTEKAGEAEEAGGAGGPYVLYYKRSGHKEVLEGHWTRVDLHGEARSGDTAKQVIHIRLEKKAPPFIPVPPLNSHKKKDSVRSRETETMLGRQTPLVMAIPVPVRQDSVKIELYDNGEIDGDSVSLYLNDQLILSHLKLLAQPKVLWIPLDKNLPVNRLVLFAENLGTLPPNTALMEVTVKGKKYTIFLSTDYKRNAM